MTHSNPTDTPISVRAPITEIEQLRDIDDVPYHERTETKPKEVVDQLSNAPDLAAIGLTNDDGEVLLRRLTESCSWQLPTASVDPDEDFVAAIRTQIPTTIGFDVRINELVGVWHRIAQTETTDRSGSQAFVVFDGAIDGEDYDLADAKADGDPVEDVGWFETLPENASEIPGTDHFI